MGKPSRQYCVHAVYYSNRGTGSARDRSSRITISPPPPPPPPPADAQQATSLKNLASNILPTQSSPPTEGKATTLDCSTLKLDAPIVTASHFNELAVSWDIEDLDSLDEDTPYLVAYRKTSSDDWIQKGITGVAYTTIHALSDDTSYTITVRVDGDKCPWSNDTAKKNATSLHSTNRSETK